MKIPLLLSCFYTNGVLTCESIGVDYSSFVRPLIPWPVTFNVCFNIVMNMHEHALSNDLQFPELDFELCRQSKES